MEISDGIAGTNALKLTGKSIEYFKNFTRFAMIHIKLPA